jgi:signal transduction histidine kinase
LSAIVEAVGYVNLALLSGLALAALWLWRRRRSRPAMWAAVTFAVLAVVADAARILPEDPSGFGEQLAVRALVGLLVLFPYLLYRFSSSFESASRRLEQLVGLLTSALLVWTFVLPDFPSEGEPRSTGFQVYLAAFVFHWTVLTIVVAFRLWRAGRDQPSVARKRMRFLAAAAVLITLALFVSVPDTGDDSGWALASELLLTVSAVAFLLGLTPPTIVRIAWRRPEQKRLSDAVSELMSATTEHEVADRVLPAMAAILGARAVALVDESGALLDVHGSEPEAFATASERGEAMEVDLPRGHSLRVWTTPYAPFFGGEELRLLRSLGALTGLALDRARLFAQERRARDALERAAELKTQFVALAAHELRAPVGSVLGFAETIRARRHQLSDEQVEFLQETLFTQIRRLSDLVEQLLDLTRLDAEVIAVEPQAVEVKPRLVELVRTAAGERAADVAVEVEDGLHAVVDPAVLDRVVSNLVVNALRYGEPPVTVNAVQNDRHFRVVVQDCGPGVPREFVPRLFERFTRSPEVTRQKGGSGLGLAIARSYAHAHGGKLLYEPALPHGARFELVVPSELERTP